MGFPGGASGEEHASNAGDIRDILRSLGQGNPLEENMAPHSSLLAWSDCWNL